MEDNDEASRVRALGEILKEFDLDAIRVKIGESEYELIRREAQAAPAVTYAMPPGTAVNGAPAAAAEAAAAPAAPAAPANAKKITAPVVGVFYRASSPATDPFVSVGDRVQVGQTLCILEAMKLMNEITSDHAGVVTRILPENGNLVALGEELLWIEP
ncbi:MAG: acetyl-CoA carboxylase biotin carboxyl carrier protein [Candidatus Velthaea sp.]